MGRSGNQRVLQSVVEDEWVMGDIPKTLRAINSGLSKFSTKALNNDVLVSRSEKPSNVLALWQQWLRLNFNRMPDCVPMRF